MPLSSLAEPTSLTLRVWASIRGAAVALALFSTLLFFNSLQLLSTGTWLFSPRVFRAFNRWATDLWWGWCASLAEKGYGVTFAVTGDDLPMRENAIVTMNHQDMADITVLFSLARSKDRLGDLKWLVKDIIKWVPGVGWGMLFIGCLFIKRDWARDEAHIRRVFGKVVSNRVPLWLMTFVEGTRMSAAKLARSQAYASELGIPPPQHVLIPRTKGFIASVKGLRGHIDAVYDVTIGYVGGVPTLWQWIKGYVRHVHMHVRRFSVKDLPEGEALGAWLIERFREKDDLLDCFYRNGVFPGAKAG